MEYFQVCILLLVSVATATARNNIEVTSSSSNHSPPGLARLREGSSLKVDEANVTFLASPNGAFFAGFHEVGMNAFCFSIWLARSEGKTVVWTANRDTPVSVRRSKLTLHGSGSMVLTDSSDLIVWSTHTSSDSSIEARLLETGNLVLFDLAKSIVIWESFGFPTDTLLPMQPLMKNTTLVSVRGKGSLLSGVYNLKFDDSNVLNLVYNGPKLSSIYWPRQTAGNVFASGRTPYNSSRIAVLDKYGRFLSSDLMEFRAFDYEAGSSEKKRRLTLDYDGILRLYSLDESTGAWEISWLPSRIDSCLVDGLCGEYGVCSYNNIKPACTCPNHGFEREDISDWTKGCRPRFSLTKSPDEFDFLELPNTDFYGYDLETLKFGISLQECRNICLVDTRCKGFGYSSDGLGQCFPKSFLTNGYRMPSSQSVMFIKIIKQMLRPQAGQQADVNTLRCSGAKIVLSSSDAKGDERGNKYGYIKYLFAFIGTFGVIEAICFASTWWFIYRKHVNEEMVNMGYIALALGFKTFSYSELKRATKNFKEEIGKGGFGSVYKGILDDGRIVAVKRLEGVLQGNSEFWAEVSIIGNINHMNLVKLWGFCADEQHKLLVYEYVENSSLDKALFSSEMKLNLEQRYRIALGTAKGLSYLHEECLEWVLHCDVKPQNILLDDRLEPKVADFGMSKFFGDQKDVGFSRVRGTRGYLAPEWMMNLEIDAKADVYSYGVVILELVTGKCVSEFQIDHLAGWVSETIEHGGIEEIVDRRLLGGEFDCRKVERLVKIALWCAQEDRKSRPAMSKIVELLLESDKTSSS